MGGGWGESIRIQVKDTDTGKEYVCMAEGTYEKEMLQIALLAMTNKMNVRAKFDESKSPPRIVNIRLMSD